MQTHELLPCPFCGGEATLCDPHAAFSHLAAVFCDDCEIRGQLSVDAELAIEFWNTRAIEDADLVPAAAAIVDIWMGGNTAWRSRLGDSDFLESADWLNALELARAAIEATRPTDMEVRDAE